MMDSLRCTQQQEATFNTYKPKITECAEDLNKLFETMATQKEELIRRLSSFEEVIDEISNYMSPLQIASFIILVEKVNKARA